MAACRSSGIDRLVYAVTQMSTRRQVPAVFNVFVAEDTRSIDLGEHTRMQRSGSSTSSCGREERAEVERELATVKGRLIRLTQALRERGEEGGTVWETHDPSRPRRTRGGPGRL